MVSQEENRTFIEIMEVLNQGGANFFARFFDSDSR